MKSEDLKSIAKEIFVNITGQSDSEHSLCCSLSVFEPQVDHTAFNENYEAEEGYNPDADMNRGCWISTVFADIK
jgi:hypothetical protein